MTSLNYQARLVHRIKEGAQGNLAGHKNIVFPTTSLYGGVNRRAALRFRKLI